MMLVYVENLPKNIDGFRYIVVRAVDGKVWFYSMWRAHQASEALARAREIDGFVVENPFDEEVI